jgi:adenine-specific DNA-methyltransferase
MAKEKQPKQVEAFKHTEDKRKNNPTAEAQSLINASDAAPKVLRYPRNPDLDPQLVWRGKDAQDAADLAVQHTPLYIQEKVHPKVLIEDLLAQTKAGKTSLGEQLDLFSDFNGVPEGADKTEYYQHDQNWTNRFILGDSLQVMTSLAEREGLRGLVQAIYIDPPYGINFSSNFQWSTQTTVVNEGGIDSITREPEQVKAYRDTWKDGIHSYLSYLRDRLTAAKVLLNSSGSVFVQIGEENVHRVRVVLDEVFGPANFVSQINFVTTSGNASDHLNSVYDVILWYAKSKEELKFRTPLLPKGKDGTIPTAYGRVQQGDGTRRSAKKEEKLGVMDGADKLYALGDLTSAGKPGKDGVHNFVFQGRSYTPGNGHFKTNLQGLERLVKANRIEATSSRIGYVRFLNDYLALPMSNIWSDTSSSFMADKVYVVQTSTKVIQRCLLMATDPGDLVLDPTCGSGTTAFVAEEWGRRWITVDTSRVALALARARIMGAKYPYYILADSREGKLKESEISQTAISSRATSDNLRLGFVYERLPHVTLKAIGGNSQIDVIWEKWRSPMQQLLANLNVVLNSKWEEWDVPRVADDDWPAEAKKSHADWWAARQARQEEIDGSIAATAEHEYLYDRPHEDNKKVRVAGPFTVESLSPHRSMVVDVDGGLLDPLTSSSETELGKRFTSMILENLKAAGVQQADKSRKIDFTAVVPWSGKMVCAEGRYMDETGERRAAIFIGPEFGTVLRADLVEAAREASDGGFHVLIACAFNYEAHATEFDKLGAIPVLKARMNADLHMGSELKETSKANLFVVFGEPDIELQEQEDGRLRVEVKGVDVFKPQTGEVVSEGPDGIACWFIDTDYNEESFFVRHAYFLGADDPYDSLKRTLKAEINEEAWNSLHSAVSRPFDKPMNGRIAVKVINHLGDEVMKVYKIA